MNQRVVITGMGLSTPLGSGAATFWKHLLAGRSGIGPITRFDTRSFPVRIGGEVRDLEEARIRKEFPSAAGERDGKIALGLAAAAQAIRDAQCSAAMFAHGLLIVGVSLEAFSLDVLAPFARAENPGLAVAERLLRGDGCDRVQTPLDRLAEVLGDRYGFSGGRYTNCSACAAGAQAIGEAFHQLREGSAAIALAGAADSVLNPLGLGGFSLLQILSTENDRPTQACRPFDATRQGTVLSEGAAFLVLEPLAAARNRGARVYAEMLGYGSSLDAYRVTDPEPEGRGAAIGMTRAIRDAGLDPDAIDAVNAHGTGTPKNDVAETRALRLVLGVRGREVPVTANKSMTGHLIAASGAVEAAASALTLFDGVLPPTINLAHPDPECELNHVTGGRRLFGGRTVLSNSFGFGGQNATLILGKVAS